MDDLGFFSAFYEREEAFQSKFFGPKPAGDCNRMLRASARRRLRPAPAKGRELDAKCHSEELQAPKNLYAVFSIQILR